nr:phomoxanthone P [Diaporthe sp.]
MASFSSWPRPTKTYHTKTYDRIAHHHGFDGKGKTIVITGGASGVGLSISKAFAAAGVARLVIVSRSPGPQEKAKAALEAAFPSLEVAIVRASITDLAGGQQQQDALLAQILRGGPGGDTADVLILCAGNVPRRAPAVDADTAEVREAFDTNAVAAFGLARAYLSPETPNPPGGCKTVLNVSSAAALVQGTLRVGYGSSKAAGAQVMQHFAFEHMQQAGSGDAGRVKVISFHPGSFYTPSVAALYAEDHFQWDDFSLPADFSLWLAGPESGFLNGRYVWAHWDVDELMALKERVVNDPKYLTIGLIM